MSLSLLKWRLEMDARGGLCKGSKSKSSTNTSTSTTDRRMVTDGGSTALNLSQGGTKNANTTTVNITDGGIVKEALDTVKAVDATNGEGFEKLLDLAGVLFEGGGELLKSSQATSTAQIEAINAASADKAGAIDQKTMIVLAVAGATAAAAIWGKK